MRILILGAGALGGYFGARLLAAGRDVTLLVRPGTAKLLVENGLQVLSPLGDVYVDRPTIVQAQDIRQPFDLILLSCKSYDLDDAMASIAPAVGRETSILPLLNGLAHLGILEQRFGSERVLGGTSRISATRDADGTIRHLNDYADIYFGARFSATSSRLEAIAAALGGAGFNARLRPNILQDMWEKWSYLAALAGATCLMRGTIGDVVTVDASLPIRIYAECRTIAAAEGYPPAQSFIDSQTKLLSDPASALHASMLRDMEAKAPIEAHQIIGDLLDRGLRHSLATPLLETVYAHLRVYEERRAREGAKA